MDKTGDLYGETIECAQQKPQQEGPGGAEGKQGVPGHSRRLRPSYEPCFKKRRGVNKQ